MSASITAPLAALTTIFTPPCSTSWLLESSKDPSQFPPFPTSGPTSCDPPDWAVNLEFKGFQYYSPAICPSGFEVGAGCGITTTRTTEGFPAVAPGETAVYCVPSGQSCTTDLTDFRGGVWGATSQGGTFTVGPALQIRFKQSDLSFLETHPLTPGLTLSAPSSSIISSTTADVGSVTIAAIPTATGDIVLTTTISTSGSVTETLTTLASILPSQTSVLDIPQAGTGNTTTNVAVITVVLSALLAVVAMCLFRLVQLRRRQGQCLWHFRRRRSSGMVAVGLGAWIGSRPSDEENSQDRRNAAIPDRELPAELDGEVGPTFELPDSEKTLASTEHVVELEGDHALILSPHASWVSRMLSRVTRSSTTTRSRSSSRSRWTQRSLRFSGDWETFIQEKSEAAASWPGLPSIPDAAYSRPVSMSSFSSDGNKTFAQVIAPQEVFKTRNFDRLSNGTFGKVVVRGRRLGVSPSRKD